MCRMRLSPIFRRLAQSVLIASAACVPIVLGACSGDVTASGTDGGATDSGGPLIVPPNFIDELCGANGYEPLVDLGIDARYDAVALTYAGGSPTAERGVLCATATDRPACERALEAARTAGQGGLTVARTEDELRSLVAPVRAAHAAALVLRPSGYFPVCPEAKSFVGPDTVELIVQRGGPCAPTIRSRVAVARDGSYTVLDSTTIGETQSPCAVGRRFEELGVVAAGAEDGLGEFLAKIAYLEAAAVHAFARLEAELAHHGAPARLLKQVRQARRDEVRHAATMTKLAVRHGGVVPAVEAPTRAVPSLEEIAMENRVEGCLRESYGAAVAAFQAARATDPRIAQALAGIAVDEAAHAELSWAIDAWATAKLDRRAQARMDVAYAEALEALRSEVALSYRAEVTEKAGMPTAVQAIALLDGMLELDLGKQDQLLGLVCESPNEPFCMHYAPKFDPDRPQIDPDASNAPSFAPKSVRCPQISASRPQNSNARRAETDPLPRAPSPRFNTSFGARDSRRETRDQSPPKRRTPRRLPLRERTLCRLGGG
ncbi:hypothetical protein OUZ56_032524 [Daphnia magna]|uniref:Ferritin-like domain-containing protein n=1 Tax=Daphnia magna TaxID=35525 RepID=A0ABR0B959_9CRUS|nr:hypothetical protein OUZ56_032524 [Daphnia magna]